MKRYTTNEVSLKINSFLSKKLAKFPQLKTARINADTLRQAQPARHVQRQLSPSQYELI